tara:strand:- start:198 stop:431 length:234 start_codon:yes stop_codon:yes gene_type:complete
MNNKLYLVVLTATLSSCSGLTVADAYVEADNLTYKAVAPHYRQYLEADETLSEGARASRLRLIETWKMRIDANRTEK